MTDPLEIRYAKIQERLEPCVTELNIKNKTVKVPLKNAILPKRKYEWRIKGVKQ